MTNKTQMPEPVAWYHPSEDGYDSSFRDHSTILSCPSNPWEGFIPLITTDQAEAYADARVREALEEAARLCDTLDNKGNCDEYRGAAHYSALRIRALIPRHDNE